jgi:AraC family transcriptional activator of pobA
MKSKETASDFHQRHGKDYSNTRQFNVYRIEEYCNSISLPHNRRDFYKICLVIKGEGILSYADKVIYIKDDSLTFTNPMIPYSWDHLSENESGYFCLFTEDFINHNLKADSLAESPLFKVSGNHVLIPDQKSMAFLGNIFELMLTEMGSAYVNKYELLRSYVQIIMHEALKIEPPDNNYKAGTSSTRISELFLELLERQFPVASPQYTVHFKNAGEFASQLSVHTNHLNRALKEALGKTTTELIAERMIKEAKALLLHSSWDIAEIGYSLGFEHDSNFNAFFKKHTGQTPNHFRRQLVSIP